jgi:hypothetical protein
MFARPTSFDPKHPARQAPAGGGVVSREKVRALHHPRAPLLTQRSLPKWAVVACATSSALTRSIFTGAGFTHFFCLQLMSEQLGFEDEDGGGSSDGDASRYVARSRCVTRHNSYAALSIAANLAMYVATPHLRCHALTQHRLSSAFPTVQRRRGRRAGSGRSKGAAEQRPWRSGLPGRAARVGCWWRRPDGRAPARTPAGGRI